MILIEMNIFFQEGRRRGHVLCHEKSLLAKSPSKRGVKAAARVSPLQAQAVLLGKDLLVEEVREIIMLGFNLILVLNLVVMCILLDGDDSQPAPTQPESTV